MFADWFVKREAGELGPFTSAELKRLAEDGQVSPDTMVRRGDSDHWLPARKVRGLFGKTREALKKPECDEAVLAWIGPPSPSPEEPVVHRAEEGLAGDGADARDVSTVAAQPRGSSVPQQGPVLPETDAPACPSCGRNLAPEAILCVSCGYNLATGRTLETVVASDGRLSAPHGETDRDKPHATSDMQRKHASLFARAWSQFGRPEPWTDRLLPACGFMWLVLLLTLILLAQLPVDVSPSVQLGIVAGVIIGPPVGCLFAVVLETLILAVLLRITSTRVPPGTSIAAIVSEVIYWGAVAAAASLFLAEVGAVLAQMRLLSFMVVPFVFLNVMIVAPFLLLSILAGFLGCLILPATVYQERLQVGFGRGLRLAFLRQILVWMPFLLLILLFR